MAVLSYREVLPRTASHKFGESPTAERKYIVTLNEPTGTRDIINTVGIFHADPHPEFAFLKCLNTQFAETDPYHAEITYSYELPKQENLDPSPLARPDVWSFQTGGAQVPCLTFYDGSGNSNRKPLQNSAKEYIEGLTTLEAEVRATISGNRATFPAAMAAAVTNGINSSPYLWGAKHTWQCSGISAQQATEVVNDTEIRYWQITVELAYRQSGWNLLLPDVGWNYLDGGNLKRAWVLDADTGEKIASGSPRALNADGSLKAAGQAPDIIGGGLGRRVFPEINFASYFGTPPF